MDFLTIGNITKDLIPGGYTVGGTVTYASVAAMRLGRQAGVLTRLGPDLALPNVYRDIELHALPSAHTLTFENVYTPDGRVQTIHAFAGAIGLEDVPQALVAASPSIVLLGPLAGELDPQVAGLFPSSLRGVVPQGWMRRWDEQGRVCHVPIACEADVLRYADVLVVSTEDVNHDISLAQCYAERRHLCGGVPDRIWRDRRPDQGGALRQCGRLLCGGGLELQRNPHPRPGRGLSDRAWMVA